MQQALGQQIAGRELDSGIEARYRRPASVAVDPQQRLIGALPGAIVLLLVVGLAFPFSALSLWTGLQTDNPLAYQGLIPLLALCTAIAHAWRSPTYVWRDTATELVVAFPFLVAALGLMWAGTRLGSIYFWYNRTDLLALALFGIGVAIILFGVGALTRSWFAVLYLLLLWPAPYQSHLSSLIIHITDATVLAVDGVLQNINVVGGWSGVSAAGDAVYSVVGPNGDEQLVGIDSPCAGAAGMFGFLIVAIPAMYLLKGSWLRKASWLAIGIALLWAFNVMRIFALFWVATSQGVNSEAFWWTHATLGVLLFTVAMGIMFYLGYRLGFRFDSTNTVATAPTMVRVRRQGWTPALALVTVVLAVALGALNHSMVDAVGLSTRFADGRQISTFALSQPAVHNVEPFYVDQYDWSRQFFGRNSTYQRFAYPNAGDGNAIWVDTVVTDERERLDLFNLQGCYNFHGYEMTAVSTVNIGYGIVGQQLQFIVPDSNARWVALSWTWPVAEGGDDAHERITLLQYVEGDEFDATIATQSDGLSALERIFGIGNGQVAVGPEVDEVLEASNEIIRSQLDEHVAGQ